MPGFSVPVAKTKCETDSVNKNLPTVYSATHSPSNLIETARNYRWLFELLPALDSRAFNGNSSITSQAPGNLLTYLKKCDRPTMDFDEIPIHNGPRTMYRPGKFKHNPIKLEFYEILGPVAFTDGPAVRIYEWMRKLVYKTEQGIYSKFSEYSFNAKLALLDGKGQYLHIYELYNCFPLNITPSNLDYEADSIGNVSVTLRYLDVKESISPNFKNL
jgi:hypothetical protein